MNWRLMGALLTCAAVVPAVLAAQTPPASPAAPAASAAPAPPPPARVAPPPLATVEGQPIEVRPPELATDKPAFPGQTRAPYHATTPINVTVLTDKLKAPWALQFLPDGKMLVTEKPGTMRIIDAQGTMSEPLTGVPAVNFQGQVGLLDVALDRDFPKSKRLFFTYSENVGQANTRIVVASARLDQAANALTDVKVIFRPIPDLPRAASANQGGRIAVAKDGALFVTIGDRSSVSPPWDYAQRMNTHLGKIIRITPEGAPAKGNPYIGKVGIQPEIWSSGHRSEEGLAFDPSGRLWESEHGPRGGDELNTPEPGKNYGWPLVVHGIDYPGAELNWGLTEQAGMEQPRYYWDPVIAPSGLAFYDGKLFPQWKGSVLVGSLGRQMLDRLTLKDGKVVNEEPLLVDLKSRVRDVRVGPEGAVYVLTDNGKLLRITPK